MKTKFLILLIGFSALSFSIQAQPIDSLLRWAYANNPELKSVRLQYEAALQKAPQVSQLPDPTLGIGVPILRPETRLGPQVLNISASQMFPWFGSLQAREDVVLAMAKSRYEKIAATRLEIDFQIKSAYYDLYLIQMKQEILRKRLRFFNAIEQVALGKVESGKAIASDVLTVQTKIEELTQQIKILQLRKRIYEVQISEATNRPLYDSITVLLNNLDIATLVYDTTLFKEKIVVHHPLIKQLDWQIEASKSEVAVNTAKGNPNLGLGLDYGLVNKRTDAFPENNGRDILIPKLMITVPIYRKGYDAKNKEEEIKQLAFRWQKESLANKILSRLESYRIEYESAVLLYALAQKQTEIATSAYDILLSAYSSKGTRFDELMMLQNDLTKYQIDLIEAIIQTHQAKFKVERLTDF